MKIVKYKIVDTFFYNTISSFTEPKDNNGKPVFPEEGFNTEKEAEQAIEDYFDTLANEEDAFLHGLEIEPTLTIIKRFGWTSPGQE